MYSVNTLSYCQITTNMRNKTSFNHRFWERLFLSGCSIDKLSSGAELNESMQRQRITCEPHNSLQVCPRFFLKDKDKDKDRSKDKDKDNNKDVRLIKAWPDNLTIVATFLTIIT